MCQDRLGQREAEPSDANDSASENELTTHHCLET